MLYKLESGKSIRIPDNTISKSMQILGLTQEEAIQMYLEDEGYEINEEQEELDKKAKASRVTATIHQARADKPKTQKERVQKEDPDKEHLIQCLKVFLEGYTNTSDVQITNKSKMIAFKMGNDSYELNLVRKRPPKT